MSEEEKTSLFEATIKRYAKDHDISYEEALQKALEEASGMEYEKDQITKKAINTRTHRVCNALAPADDCQMPKDTRSFEAGDDLIKIPSLFFYRFYSPKVTQLVIH